MRSCKLFSRLVSESMDRELAPHQRSALHLHLEKCPGCAEFESKLKLLREVCAMFTLPGEPNGLRTARLPEDARARIKAKLRSLG